MASSNKFMKRRDKQEAMAGSGSGKGNSGVVEARFSIFINDKTVPQEQYESVIRKLCSQFGKIRSVHKPERSQKGNLIFVEYVNPNDAEKAMKHINSDRELHMVAAPARPPKHFNNNNGRQPEQQSRKEANPSFMQTASVKSQSPSYLTPRQPHQSTINNIATRNAPESKDDYLSWRRARDPEPNRPVPFHSPNNRAFNSGNHPDSDNRQYFSGVRSLLRQPERMQNGPSGSMSSPPTPPKGSNSPFGQCNRCQRRAELKCQRCGDFYCSYVCQKTDWPSHKRHCFPMPELVSAVEEPVKTPEELPMKMVMSPNGFSPNGTQPTLEVTKVEVPRSFTLPLNKTPPSMARPQPDRMIVFCDDDPKSGDIVAITWPCSTNRVYIVQNEGRMGQEYREVLTWASRPENHGPPFEESPERSTLVFAEFENDWYRAVVQKVIDSEYVLVGFFDFGNAEQIHFSKLRQYTGIDDPVRYTYSVYLKDCPYDVGCPFPENVSEYLKKFSDDFTPLRLRYNGEWNRNTNVELFVAETDVCINDKICSLVGTSRAEYRKNREEAQIKLMKQNQPDKATKFYFDGLRCERMETENKTRVIVLCCDDLQSNSVWCCLETANTSIKEIDDAVNDFASQEGNLVNVIPEKNELCLVRRNERHFERAVFVEINDDKARMVSVDYGGFYYVPKDSIFKFDKSLCMPQYTHMCQIYGFPSFIEGDLHGFLKEELEENTSFIVHKITYNEEDEIHFLHMPKLLNEAISLEYLKDETLT